MDLVTSKVKQFYEQSPFPGRLVSTFDSKSDIVRRIKLGLAERTLFHKSNIKRFRGTFLKHFTTEPEFILDPACGTGEHPCLFALAFPESHVYAGDLSDKNLSYAKKLANFLKLKNITFFSSNILSDSFNPGYSGFDLIYCSGVIHHLSDPVKGLTNLGKCLNEDGRLVFGVYGKAFYHEAYINETLQEIFGENSNDDKIALLNDLQVNREIIIKNIKRENKLLKHLSIIKGDFSYLGYTLFPHLHDSTQLDGFWHPSVKYYDPNSLFEDVAEAGMEIIDFNGIKFPDEWESNPRINSLTLEQKFKLLDARDLVNYHPVCKII